MTTTLTPGIKTLYQLLPGETLVVTTDAASTCNYAQLSYPANYPDVGTAIAVPNSATITIGPRADISRWSVDQVLGTSVTVTKNPAASVPDAGAPADLCHLYGAGAPSASTGANNAAPGSLYTDVTNAKLYLQGGTKASPSWKIVTSA
jgi:hypothetical protein